MRDASVMGLLIVLWALPLQAQRDGALPGASPLERPGPARSVVAVGASFEQLWNLDDGYGLLSSDRVSQRYGLWGTYDFVRLRRDFIVALGLGWAYESESAGDVFAEQLATDLEAHELAAIGELRYALWPWLQPHARLSAGASFISTTLDSASGSRFEDDQVSPFGALGAGFVVRTPPRFFEGAGGELATLSVGFVAEGGYRLARRLDVDLEPASPEGAIELRTADLGTLQRSGPYMRLSGIVRF